MPRHIFVFETIDKSNKAHLQSCINNIDSAPIGKLIYLLKTHRQHSKSSQRSTLNARLHYLKSLEFPTKYDQKLIRLDEWFDLAIRGQAADHQTYTGYSIIEDLLLSIRRFNESIFQTHYDRMLQQERGEIPPDFKNLIDELKQKLSANGTTIPSRSPISRSTFATLQGTSHETAINDDVQKENFYVGDTSTRKRKINSKSNQSSKTSKRECPCGRGFSSSWSKCYYLTPSAAPHDFQPDPEILN
ncbi:hypothetical protein GcM3_040028 [Golovinomyces cichoracearum]|uniref:Uncharacterized protein n=1 Tax=Golovinomyces cichoracearum TaxID=62708 RepID=A0A420J2H8_9PEZI|nr:hypothetical protein GcM3_040028 [Golovinomyces cichoracearum]